MKTFATLFSGGGGVDVGLMAAGLAPLWAVEYDAAIAGVYERNIGHAPIVADVRDVDYAALVPVDWLHASPVCTRASVANPSAGEAELDIEMAQAVVRSIQAIRPQVFTLENVWQYRDFAAFRLILNALGEAGYMYDFEHINCADFGVPQTRKRLLLRAVHGALLPALPQPVPWIGWYAAIEDLIPTLPESKLAPWQLARLPEELREALLINSENAGQEWGGIKIATAPAMTIGTTSIPRAVLVPGILNGESERMTIRNGDAPSPTVTVCQRDIRAAFPCRVVTMTIRCLARFQSVPDWYQLPKKRTLAAKIVGNMVPSLLMQRIAEQMEVTA